MNEVGWLVVACAAVLGPGLGALCWGMWNHGLEAGRKEKKSAEARGFLEGRRSERAETPQQFIERARQTFAIEEAAAALKCQRMALQVCADAWEALFEHCLSNGVFNRWGKEIDCALLNKAREQIRAALRLEEAGR